MEEAPKLKRSMGVWMATALGIYILGTRTSSSRDSSSSSPGSPVYVLMKWWQTKRAEEQARELVATAPPVRSPGRESAVAAMKKGS
jgi:hypothetical protein